MNYPYYSAPTLDDLIRLVIAEIFERGDPIEPSKGSAAELAGVLLELTNPRARLSRTEMRGKVFSSLGELCWYLAGSNDLEFISYYLPQYEKFADDGVIFGGYGPRLFAWKGQNQFANLKALLARKRDSRQAVIQLFDTEDIVEEHNDIPCTCTLQFLVRHKKLHMFTNMRSNDAWRGLPHDIFSFTMLQEIMARSLSVELGTYKHAVGSLHLYDPSRKNAQQFLDEGWQSTKMPMPPMPTGDPWAAIEILLEAEASLRVGQPFDVARSAGLDSYWSDLIRLLQVFRCIKDKNAAEIKALGERMSSDVYGIFIESRLSQLL